MWYSRIKLAISKDEAERIIQQELALRSFVDPATDDENVIKQKLIQKYGTEEEMAQAINSEVSKIMSEFNQSSPWVSGSSETHSHFSTPYEAFYVMPDGSVTPNLRSHVMFDKYLLSRLGVNPEALKDRSDRHILSELTGAMRINLNNGRANATIYTNPTPQQLDWLKKNDITREELDIRRGTEVEYGDKSAASSDQYSEAIVKISELNINEFSRQLDNAKDQLQSIIGNISSSYDENYRRVDKAENPNNLPEDQIEKLTKIYLGLQNAATSLFEVEEALESL
jgi:hypothetical protein